MVRHHDLEDHNMRNKTEKQPSLIPTILLEIKCSVDCHSLLQVTEKSKGHVEGSRTSH